MRGETPYWYAVVWLRARALAPGPEDEDQVDSYGSRGGGKDEGHSRHIIHLRDTLFSLAVQTCCRSSSPLASSGGTLHRISACARSSAGSWAKRRKGRHSHERDALLVEFKSTARSCGTAKAHIERNGRWRRRNDTGPQGAGDYAFQELGPRKHGLKAKEASESRSRVGSTSEWCRARRRRRCRIQGSVAKNPQSAASVCARWAAGGSQECGGILWSRPVKPSDTIDRSIRTVRGMTPPLAGNPQEGSLEAGIDDFNPSCARKDMTG
ncbi:hypothetical protein B0H19DRAFT_1075735 [Mycena capillaripes]|nr:hypothetical protein B0H19DRAFT_1075735 [Mycena capillaripes]